MGFLDIIGLNRKTKGSLGSSKSDTEKEAFWNMQTGKFGKIIILVLFFAGVILSFPRYIKQEFTYEVGLPWRQDDVTAPYDFAILKTDKEIERERQEITRLTPPIFHLDDRARIRIQTRLDSMMKNMDEVYVSFIEWQNKEGEARLRDSLNFNQKLNSAPVGLNAEAWNPLLEDYLLSHQAQGNRRFVGIDLRLKIEFLVNEILQDGIINKSKSDIDIDELIVRNLKERTERSTYKANVRDIREAREFGTFRLGKMFGREIAYSASRLFELIIEPNLIYNPRETELRVAEAVATISPTKGAISLGTTIVRKGDVLTEEKFNLLRSLDQAKAQRATKLDLWQQFAGDILVVFAIFVVFFMYLYLYRKNIYEENRSLILVFLSILIICALSAVASRLDWVSEYAIPISITPIILTIIFDSRVGIVTAISLAMTIALMNGNNFEFLVAAVTASSMGVYSVRDIRNRSQFFLFTPALIASTYAVVITGFTLSRLGSWEIALDNFIDVGIHTLLTFFAFPIILIFEKIFKITTDITLLELSDTNRPLLKALMMRAPGTFHHSLQVANLSEAAASAIGANALLCRVAAYYHDIGKMEKAEYYVENQSGYNLHDKLKPMMSARIIKSHISSGVKMAEEENLPIPIIDFIKTHHGTSTIRYFYERARSQASSDTEINESDFKYDGPLPTTKETGIVLLADGIEATARSMEDANYFTLENMINRMVDERVSEGQLSHTPLTFDDLLRIKQAFLTNLVGMFHGRIKYPGQDKLDAQPQPKTAAPVEYSKPVGPKSEARI